MRPFVALGLLFLLAPVAWADQPLESVDAFEAGMTKCLASSSTPASCFEAQLGGHFPPGNERLNQIVSQAADLFQKWLGRDKVYAVHAVKVSKLGTYAERRVYLIEDTTGSLMMLDTSFVHRIGKWYVLKYNLTSTKDEVRTVLGEVL